MRCWARSIALTLILVCLAPSALADAKVRSLAFPLSFEPNLGQASPETAFLSHGQVSVQLRGNGFDMFTATSGVSFDFVGASEDTTLSGEGRLPWVSNYLANNDRSQWRTNVPHYRAVRYRSLYPGIDARFYANERSFEHDFIVSPGADYRQIVMRVRGAERIELSSTGNLVLRQHGEQYVFQRPVVSQEIGGKKITIEAGFELRKDDRIGFRMGSYDRTQALIIDPVVRYITYLGGTDAGITALAVDASGNAYVGGSSCDKTFPIANLTPSPCGGGSYVAKLDSAGTPVFITYVAIGIAGIGVDRAGDAIAFGESKNNGGTLLSLSPSGTSLNYSVTLAGVLHPRALSVRPDGDCFVAVETFVAADKFISTPGALRVGIAPYVSGAAVVHFDANGQVIYSAIIAGFNITVTGLATDSGGSAYLVGRSDPGLPTTQGAYQMTPTVSIVPAAFIAKINPQGSAFSYLTYIGGNNGVVGGYYSVGSVAVDATGSIYFILSGGISPTPGSYNWPAAVPLEYLVRLSPDGSKVLFSSVVSGYTNSYSSSHASWLAVDAIGNIYFSGNSTDDLIPRVNAIQLPNEFDYDPNDRPYLAALTPDGSSLWFATPALGGHIVAGSDGYIYVYGTSHSQDLPTTPGAYQPWLLGPVPFTSGFVAVLDPHADGPAICPNPDILSFGSIVYQSSASQTSTITNCGKLAFSPIFEMTGDFSQTNDCPPSLVPGASCTTTIKFEPRTPTDAGRLNIRDEVTKISQRVYLLGNWVGGVASVSPKTVTFGPQAIGTTSSSIDVTLTNVGTYDLYAAPLSIAGDFAQTTDCVFPLGFYTFNNSCHIHVTFSPTVAGTRTGQLLFIYAVNGTVMATVSLNGRGIPEQLSGGAVDLGRVLTGVVSRAGELVISNRSPDPLSLTGLSSTAPFNSWSTCGGTVPANGNCTVMVSVFSASPQTLLGTLSFNVGADPYIIPLHAVAGDLSLSLARPARNPRLPSSNTVGNNFSVEVTLARSRVREPSFACTAEAAYICRVRVVQFATDHSSRLIVSLFSATEDGIRRAKKNVSPVKLLADGEVTMEVLVDVDFDESSDELKAASPDSRPL